MSSIDNRIVQLSFDNGGFESGVRTTLGSLDKLKASLNFSGAKTAFGDIDKAAQGVHLGPIGTAIEGVNLKFMALATVAVTALSNITTAAMSAGASLAKSLSIDPIMQGYQEYETQMNSVQTILSNTQASGAKLKDVSAALDELNAYADKTIYNFTEMTRNIGAFTAAGVGLDESVAAIKGIANLAAMSGSNSQQAATAMYQLSQAISAGRVSLADWNSVVNAGMGGTVFQRNLAQTAVAMGVLDENALKLSGDMKTVTINGQSFRESISTAGGGETWLTSEVLTTALSTFTGDLSKAELAAIGFNKAQIKAIQAQAQTANEAATKVKTLTQLLDTTKEAVGSGWAQTWRLIFGDFNEARNTFSMFGDQIGELVQRWSDARNDLLQGWKDLGGRKVLIQGFKAAFDAIGSIIAPIKDAFREIFPPKTASDLLALTQSFKDFFENLKMGEETASKVRRTFAGVFAVFSMVGKIIGGVVSAFTQMVSPIREASGGFLDITARIGDWLVSVNNALTNGEGLKTFFQNLGEVIAAPVRFLVELGKSIANVFGNTDKVDAAGEAFGRIGDRVSVLQEIFDNIKEGWSRFISAVTASDSIFARVVGRIREEFSKIGSALSDAFKSGNFDKVLDLVNTGLLGGLLLLFKKFVDEGASIFKIGLGDGVTGAFRDFANGITGALKAMTAEIRANAILKIAIAVAILAASLIALSLVDSDDLTKGILGITALMAGLVATLAALDKFVSGGGALKLPLIGAGLILVAAGIAALAGAVRILGDMDMGELAKGLGGVAAAIIILIPAVNSMGKASPSIILAAVAMLSIGQALNNLADAIDRYGTMDWKTMIQGFIGVTAALVLLTRAMSGMPNENSLAKGLALIAMAAALNLMANAIERLGALDMGTIAKGLLASAGAMAILAGAARAMPDGMIAKAAGLMVMAAALHIIAGAVKKMGEMEIKTIATGLISLAGAMIVLATGLRFMQNAVPGAAALAIVAAALLVFVPALAALGSLPVPVIVTGLVALAGAFAVLGAASLILSEATPVMLALGASLMMVGAAVALVGAGVWLFVKALEVLVNIGKTAANVLIDSFNNIALAIPAMMNAFSSFLIELSKTIVETAPEMGKAFVALINTGLDAFIKVAPKMRKAAEALIDLVLGVIKSKASDFIDTGFLLLIKLADGLTKRLGPLVDAAVALIKKFLQEIGSHAQEMTEAGIQFIIDLANGVAEGIRSKNEALRQAGANLAGAIVSGMTLGMSDRIGEVVSAAGNLAGAALDRINSIFQIASPSKRMKKIGQYVSEGFAEGIIGGLDQVVSSLDSLRSVIKSEADYYEGEVKRLKQVVKQLEADDNVSKKKVKEAKEALAEAEAYSAAYGKALVTTNKEIKEHKARLAELGTAWEKNSDDIAKAEQDLKSYQDATKAFNEGLVTSFSELPDITDETTLDTYFDAIRDEAAANKKFLESLNDLKAMGIDDTTYQKLLDEGVDAQPFIDSLIAAGPVAVGELNNINAGLISSAKNIADTATPALRTAGEQAIQGILDGLKTKKTEIEGEMVAIADLMAKAIRKALKIKSPSRVFAEVGKFSNQGLAKGLKDYSKLSSDAASDMGTGAVTAIKDSMNDISHLDFDIDTTPVITPVLDLDQFQKDATQIGGMLKPNAIVPTVATTAAKDIANMNAIFESMIAAMGPPSTNIEYNQYNNSPKALSNAEIYRQTRNQLAILKGALQN